MFNKGCVTCRLRVFRFGWSILAPNNNNSQVALAIVVIAFSSLIGLLCAFIYGLASRSAGGWNSLTGGCVAVLACVGAFSAGGMLGLLFGSPNWGSAGAQAKEGNGEKSQQGIRPNTSLERIADWLTTMIVGLSLVNLKAIEERSSVLGVWLTQAISGSASAGNGTPGIVIAISFAFFGFLLVYLWAMRFLPAELRSSYSDLSARINDIEVKFRKEPLYKVPAETLSSTETVLRVGGVDDRTIKDVTSRYSAAQAMDDEPMKDFGPTDAQGYRVSAKVSNVGGRQCQIETQVKVPDGSTATKVFWLFHNTFTPGLVAECPVKDGYATYTTMADESFWLGLIVPLAGTDSVRLAMNLAEAEGAPDAFKAIS
jgi:hypothetical protein